MRAFTRKAYFLIYYFGCFSSSFCFSVSKWIRDLLSLKFFFTLKLTCVCLSIHENKITTFWLLNVFAFKLTTNDCITVLLQIHTVLWKVSNFLYLKFDALRLGLNLTCYRCIMHLLRLLFQLLLFSFLLYNHISFLVSCFKTNQNH